MIVNSTIAIHSRHQIICLMLVLVAMLSSCASDQVQTEEPVPPVVVEEPEPMSLLLACAPANSNRALTRLADEVVQLNDAASYRLLQDFRIIAQKKNDAGVFIIDSWVDSPSQLVNESAFKYYHSSYCSMIEGVNACLVYAKAKDEDKGATAATKVYNGSLKPEISAIPTWMASSDDIQFNLDPIITDATVGDDGIPAEAWTLANALTAIIDGSHNGSTLVWKTSTNVILNNLLQRYTNNGADLPGSAASVKQWMLSLRDAADSYLENPPTSIGDDEKTLLGIIRDKANTAAEAVTGNYPRDINLPDGAAALRWTGDRFEPQMQTTTLDDINSVSRFVYPPALYYFVDSDIKTSPNLKNYAVDLAETPGLTWSDFVTSFPKSEVESNSKTVVVKDPLQYAVAHLTMRVQANANSLPYETGNANTIDISKLTLKGVMIGGQRPVGYDFKPTSNSQYDVSFIYDSQVNCSDPDSDPEKLSVAPATYHTLALQSYDGEDLNIILEFEYSAEETTGFKCLNGYVYPGTRFYLVGEVKATAFKEETGDETSRGRVFTQDYTTAINMTVKSLEKAYNVLPSLLSNSLEIGVMITPQWISAEPSGPVILD